MLQRTQPSLHNGRMYQMSLKLKVVLIVLGVFVLSGALNYGIQRYIVYPNFVDLEHEEAQKNLERSVRAIKRELYHLVTLSWDWASWDDTYDFIESHYKEYIESNLGLSMFTGGELNTIYIVDNDRKVVWGEIYNLETEETMKLADFPKDVFPKAHPLISDKTGKKTLSDLRISGVFMTEQGPMLISSHPILTSNDEGPVRGSLIMGRFLNDKVVRTLVDQTEVSFKVLPIKDDSLPESTKDILKGLTPESQYLIEEKGDDHLLVYTSYPDLKGNPALLIKATIPRKITAKGYTAMRYASISIGIATLVILIVMSLLFQHTVLRPITKLTGHAVSIGKTGDLSVRLPINSQDEIGTLASEFDSMVANLEKNATELARVNTKLKKDITMRKQAEGALQESEEKLRTIIEHSNELFYLHDTEHVLTYVSPTSEEILGYTPEEMMRKGTELFTDNPINQKGIEITEKAIKTG